MMTLLFRSLSLPSMIAADAAHCRLRRLLWACLLTALLPILLVVAGTTTGFAQHASDPLTAASEAVQGAADKPGDASQAGQTGSSESATLPAPEATIGQQTSVKLTPEQLALIADGEANLKALSTRLDDIDRELLPENALAEERLAQLRSLLRSERDALHQWQSDLDANADPLRLKLADLGPAPETSEEASLAELRSDLETLLTPFDGLATQREALDMQISRQLGLIAERRRDLFLVNIFTPTPAVFSLEFWRAVPSVVRDLSQSTTSLVGFRLKTIATQLQMPGRASSLLIFLMVMAMLLVSPAIVLRRYAQRRGWSLEALSSRHALIARALEVVWPPAWVMICVASFLVLFQSQLNLVASFSWLVMSLASGLAAALLVWRVSGWLERLAELPAAAAYLRSEVKTAGRESPSEQPTPSPSAVKSQTLFDRLLPALMTLLVCLQLTLQGLIDIFAKPVESEWLTVLIFAPLQILGLIWLMRPATYRRLFLRFFPWIFAAFPLRWALRRTPLFAAIGLILGFIALVGFVLPRLWLFLMALLLAAGLRTSLYLWWDLAGQPASEEPGRRAEDSGTDARKPADEETVPSESARDIKRFWVVLAVNTTLVTLGLPLVLMLLGYEAWALLDWLDQLAQPISLGSLQLSPFNLFLGVGLFILAWMGVRYVKVVMAEQVLPRTNLMADVRHSLVTLLGYVGFTIAGLVGLGVAGLDLSRFALIAGALSVGIGFGLQAIVSNFVSGLILLFERPVKLGDWVVLSSGEGIVKRISIRATEIETFDGRAIMVPNSELITAPVANWTHRSHKGRVLITVGVAYESNPKQVEAILYDVANSNPLVLRAPAPTVYLANFGDSSLDFQLRVHIADIFNVLTVSHQIRLAIFDAFQEQGISIPFPQQELRIKTEVEGIQVASPVFQVEAGATPRSESDKDGKG